MPTRRRRRRTKADWLTICRQVGTVLLALGGALGTAKVSQDSGTRQSDSASQNAGIYIIMVAQQQQIDSLSHRVRVLERRTKRAPRYRYVTEAEIYGPPVPEKKPPRAKRWLAALGTLLTGGG